MTEKRYKLHYDYKFGYGIEDTLHHGRMFMDTFEEITNELNILHKENERLKEHNKLMEKTLDNINEELAKYRNEWVDL
jgi:hypothetical protein